MPDRIGLDTSIVVRLLVGEPDYQVKAATKLITQAGITALPVVFQTGSFLNPFLF